MSGGADAGALVSCDKEMLPGCVTLRQSELEDGDADSYRFLRLLGSFVAGFKVGTIGRGGVCVALVLLMALAPAIALGQDPAAFVSPHPEEGGHFGSAVTAVGDVAGDGGADVLVGAMDEDVDTTENAGRAYVFEGDDRATVHTLTAPAPEAEEQFGSSVARIGDVDRDGIPDLAVGANGPEHSGRVYLFDGRSGERIRTLRSPNETSSGFFARSMAGLGDVDGDGAADLAVGAIGEGEDRVYVFSGSDGSILYTVQSPTGGHDHFGSVSALGDIDADGVSDLLIAASTTSIGDHPEAGRAYLHSGAEGERLRTLPRPDTAFGHFGYLSAAVGDVNGNGTPEVAVGAAAGTEGGGRIYVIDTRDGSLVTSFAPPAPSRDGYRGYNATGIPPTEETEGGQLLLGTFVPTNASDAAGRAYLYDIGSGERTRTFTPPHAQELGYFGISVARVPRKMDVEASVVLIAAYQEDVDGVPKAGRVYRFTLR